MTWSIQIAYDRRDDKGLVYYRQRWLLTDKGSPSQGPGGSPSQLVDYYAADCAKGQIYHYDQLRKEWPTTGQDVPHVSSALDKIYGYVCKKYGRVAMPGSGEQAGQKPAQTPQSSSSASPKATTGPLASARSGPWNLNDLQEQAKALSASDIPALGTRASGGDARSQFLLGLVYEFGHAGIPQDLREALRWFKRAAEQGIWLPEAWVGDFYYAGIGIPVDYAEALRWYTRASNNGYHSRMIGYLYLNGQGVERDYFEARRRFQLAANGGDETARKIMADLERNCSTQVCIDLQSLLVLRRDDFYLVRGDKLGETTEGPEEVLGDILTTVVTRWKGRLLVSGAESCEVQSHRITVRKPGEKTGRSETYLYYDCILGRDLSQTDAGARFDQITGEIRAAFPPNAHFSANRRFEFYAGPRQGVKVVQVESRENRRREGDRVVYRQDLLLRVTTKD
ncbi:MAG: sel1 repeat family protein [Deltaproteobacteria bacterium]|nr:sel1 repeat family protein [Deltaproteobacteria bacterium]